MRKLRKKYGTLTVKYFTKQSYQEKATFPTANSRLSESFTINLVSMTSQPQTIYLAIAIIQSQDERKTSHELQKAGFEIVSVATHGALLGRRNTTLLVRVQETQIPHFLEIIHTYCHERTEYIATPLEGTPLPIPISTPITIGGATVFFIPIESFEEL